VADRVPTVGDPGPCQQCGKETAAYCGACYDWVCSDECHAKHVAEQHGDAHDPAAGRKEPHPRA